MNPAKSGTPSLPAMHTAVVGVGIWTSGVPNCAAWMTGTRDAGVAAAAGLGLDRRTKRRASKLARAMADAFSESVTQANGDPARLPTVFGSALGEAPTMIKLLDQMWRTREELSPMMFAMSVHNAASGLVSISSKNHGFTTSLAADYDTPAMALMEANGVVHRCEGTVIVTCGDDLAPRDLVPDHEMFGILAVSLALAPIRSADASVDPAPGDVLATLRGPFMDEATLTGATVEPTLARNPQVGMLDLADAVLHRRQGTLRLD